LLEVLGGDKNSALYFEKYVIKEREETNDARYNFHSPKHANASDNRNNFNGVYNQDDILNS
jgi:hypothetical protein